MGQDFPEYFPLLILYDPPGGQSYSYYESSQSSVTLKHDSYEAFNGGYAKANLGINWNIEGGVCAAWFEHCIEADLY